MISQITPGSDRRLVLFDPKNELHPALFGDVQVPVHFLLPSDARSSRWGLARDFDSPAAIMQFCKAFVPNVPGDSNPFFTTALQELMGGVISSLNRTQPGRWDLADVVHILESREYTAQVLNRTPESRSKLRFMSEERMWSGIKATSETRLNPLRIIAALWSRTGCDKTFSATSCEAKASWCSANIPSSRPIWLHSTCCCSRSSSRISWRRPTPRPDECTSSSTTSQSPRATGPCTA